jgi:thiol:disulfide interchange protein DsbD
VLSIASQACPVSRRFALALCWLALVFAAKAATAAGDNLSAPHVKISLVSEQNAMIDGKDNWVGFYFQLEPGWHIYWINPGDSGAPPRITWKLPPGFTAGEILWPYPERIATSSLMDYGYEGSVLLMAQLHAPPKARTGPVPVAADLRWLVCRELCLPGHAELQLSLPVAAARAPNPKTHSLFESTRQRIPKPAPARWKLRAQSRKDSFLLSIQSGHPEEILSFFPLRAGQIEDAAAQTVRSLPLGASLELKKSEQLQQTIPTLTGVVVLASGQAYVIDASVPSATAMPNPAGTGGLKKHQEALSSSN